MSEKLCVELSQDRESDDFSSWSLDSNILLKLAEVGFMRPTSIQKRVRLPILEGRDLLAEAPTGSGKTVAFVLPILQRLLSLGTLEGEPKVLVLAPTRELAIQVADVFNFFTNTLSSPLSAVALVGGVDIELQREALLQKPAIVTATTGRLVDILDRKMINLSLLKFLVLDEADRLLDGSFAKEFNNIKSHLPPSCQYLLFSATLKERFSEILADSLKSPVTLSIHDEETPLTTISQRVILVNRERRGPLLQHLIAKENWRQVLVFVASCKATQNVAAKLRKYNIHAEALNGDLFQDQRVSVLNNFKAKKIRVLVVTDIATRGLDISNLPIVINFDLPRSPNDYVHRIGRTGRAGALGVAISFIGHEDQEHFHLIEKRASIKLPRETIPGFELQGEAMVLVKKGAPIKGKRLSKKDKLRLQNSVGLSNESHH